MSDFADRDTLLELTDEQLLSRCRIDFTKATGNGGQKRNKTSSAVRLSLPEPAISAFDCSERSQYRNRALALFKLRLELARRFRITPATPPKRPECALEHADYPGYLAHLMDLLEVYGCDQKLVAAELGVSASKLLKIIYRDRWLWSWFTAERQRRGLPVLKVS